MKNSVFFTFIVFTLLSFQGNAQHWAKVSSGVNGSDEAMINYKGNLLAGGVSLTPITQWDGSGWTTFGSGAPITTALFVDGDTVFAGGTFYASAKAIFKYSGTSWSQVGGNHAYDSLTSGTGDQYNAIFKINKTLFTVHGGGFMWYDRAKDLFRYANNYITFQGNIYRKYLDFAGVINNVAYFYSKSDTSINSYDGTNWKVTKLPTTYSHALLTSVKAFNGEIYLSGTFVQGIKGYSLIKFDGASTFSNVIELTVIAGGYEPISNLYPAGGYLFAIFDHYSYIRVGIINGASINQLGDSLYLAGSSIALNTLNVYNNEVYLGGIFKFIANDSANNIVKVGLPGGIPAAPSSLSIVPVIKKMADSRLLLSWNDNSANESGFRIFRSTDGVSFIKTDSVGANKTSFKDSTLNQASIYYYKICAYNASGQSAFSNIASATTFSGINSQEISKEDFEIYPNPSKGLFYCHYKGKSNQEINITVLDINGRKVYDRQIDAEADNTLSIDLNNLSNGIYLVKMLTDDSAFYSKILIEK